MLRIDIEDLAGIRIGEGPIMTATVWEHQRQLDRAGNFSFQMPAADPRMALVYPYRVARAWRFERNLWRRAGAGLIMNTSLTTGVAGADILHVEGPDWLHMLSRHTVDELKLYEEVRVHPAEVIVLSVNPPGTTHKWQWYDRDIGDTTTSAKIDGLASNHQQYIYVKFHRRIKGVYFLIGPDYNTKAATLQVQYFDATVGGWSNITVIRDDTLVNGKPFALSGRIEWDMPANQTTESTTNSPVYDYRFSVDNGLDAFDVSDITVLYDTPTSDGLRALLAQAPAGWSLDTALGYVSTKPAIVSGDNLLLDPSFDIYTGTPDDGNTDTFTWWKRFGTAFAGDVEVSNTARTSGKSIKFYSDGTWGDGRVGQYVQVLPNSDYRLTIWSKGDGTYGEAAFRIYDISPDDGNATALTNTQDLGTSTTWHEYIFYFTSPPNRTQIYVTVWGTVTGLVGTCYVDDVSFERYIPGDVYSTLNNVSILEGAVQLSRQTGEHFVLAVNGGPQIIWLRDDVRHSEVQLIAEGDSLALQNNLDVALIVEGGLTRIRNAYELATRVYAFSGGSGENRVSLQECTSSAPSGYVLNTAEGYLERTAATAVLGRIDKRMNFPEINAISTDASQRTYAANQLFRMAYAWLKRHSATNLDPVTGDMPAAYSVIVTKLDRMILPGYWIRLKYRRMREGTAYVLIDEDLCVLSSTTNITQDNMQTVAMELGTVDVPLLSDIDVLNSMLRQANATQNQTLSNERHSSGGAGIPVTLDVVGGRVTTVKRQLGGNGSFVVDGVTYIYKDGVIT